MSADIEPAPPPAAAPAPDSARSTAWCSKMLGLFCRNRNRVNPGRVEFPDCDFVNVAPGRTLRVLRPELKSDRYYEAPTPNNRPESINDNFYARWARRPHPSGNCRCSFRQSSNSNRLSSTEEKLLSRIRTSLCEAEKSGTDIQELEKSLAVDLSQLEPPAESEQPQEDEEASNEVEQIRSSKLEPLEESVKQRIVKDLDKYISALLDEILSDTIRAIVRADNPFDKTQQQPAAAFDINFSFHNSDDGEKGEAKEQAEGDDCNKGYINRGFVGSASDPDALDFDLRHGVNNGAILETADCIDSGINSVETIELQPEQEQNLEQSLIDIIDAKLGGASIGKSLEDLRTEIDDTDKAKTPKSKEPEAVEAEKQEVPKPEEPAAVEEEVKKSKPEEKRVTIKEPPVSSPADRTSRSLDDVTEEPAFNSLRLEFRRPKPSKDAAADSKSTSSSTATNSSSVSSRVNKTMSAIRQRLAIRLGSSRRKQHSGANGKSSGSSSSRSSTRSTLELEDYRRRFPVPDGRHRHQFKYDSCEESEVVLRNRKPTLVFLHGFGSSADAFEPQLRYFTSLGYPCLAPDLLGHGLSTAPNRSRDYQFARLLEDLETVLLQYAFKPGQKCVIVAHNYGCSFATALAQKYVSSVHQLVLISGGGPTPLAPPPAEGSFRCFLRGLLAPLLFCGMQRAILYAPRGRQHPYCGGELEENQRPSHMRHVLSGMAWPEGDYVFHRRICTPTLLVHGLRDNLVSLVQECQMERTMVKAFLEAIPAAGHMPMTDCPEQLNHMIHCFIDLWKNKKW